MHGASHSTTAVISHLPGNVYNHLINMTPAHDALVNTLAHSSHASVQAAIDTVQLGIVASEATITALGANCVKGITWKFQYHGREGHGAKDAAIEVVGVVIIAVGTILINDTDSLPELLNAITEHYGSVVKGLTEMGVDTKIITPLAQTITVAVAEKSKWLMDIAHQSLKKYFDSKA